VNIQPEFFTVYIIFAGLIEAIVWDLIIWYFGPSSSSSYALIGGLIGSGLIAGGSKSIVIAGVENINLYGCLTNARFWNCICICYCILHKISR
jgi:inorganic phosphate transporter, PiT family